jgi:hypothetical protein
VAAYATGITPATTTSGVTAASSNPDSGTAPNRPRANIAPTRDVPYVDAMIHHSYPEKGLRTKENAKRC